MIAMTRQWRIALHAVVGVVDDLNRKREDGTTQGLLSPFILGVSCNDSSNMSTTLARVGRFEKFVFMSPPTEKQRREILL